MSYKIVGRRLGDVGTHYGDPGLALRELNWKANRGLKEMCKWPIVLQRIQCILFSHALALFCLISS